LSDPLSLAERLSNLADEALVLAERLDAAAAEALKTAKTELGDTDA
jgi:hypothetical protein